MERYQASLQRYILGLRMWMGGGAKEIEDISFERPEGRAGIMAEVCKVKHKVVLCGDG